MATFPILGSEEIYLFDVNLILKNAFTGTLVPSWEHPVSYQISETHGEVSCYIRFYHRCPSPSLTSPGVLDLTSHLNIKEKGKADR